ncbi:hypothetical protein AMATHDRAFT_65571 [Amanita thiersii Skay4041]|uniref:Uncharacterized protein n=1 Tax=Amanita thiersii Skay4041 TaxID=703135 RepID=A0A2A9NJI0_9AGAR|nr:hypothetical protein AMATHDRAFT_65571 [Amanita thiersii Skay4041]
MPFFFSGTSSPTSGFFPTGTTSPNAFMGFHQDPRDTHAMYAAFGSSMTMAQPGSGKQTHGQGSIKRK